jgi:hypothetical protein
MHEIPEGRSAMLLVASRRATGGDTAKHRIAAAITTLAACVALAWAGDEPKTYEIDWHERWKAGQIVTVTEHETMNSTSSVDGEVGESEHAVLDATYVVRCDRSMRRASPSSSRST